MNSMIYIGIVRLRSDYYPSLSPCSRCAGNPGEPHVRNMQENEY